MDEILRTLKRQVTASPSDIEVAQKYIRALERVAGITTEAIDPHPLAKEHAAHAANYLLGRVQLVLGTHAAHISAYAHDGVIRFSFTQYDPYFNEMMTALGSLVKYYDGLWRADLSYIPGFCSECQFIIEPSQYDAHQSGW